MTTYIIIGAAVIVAVGVFIACKPKTNKADKTKEQTEVQSDIEQLQDNPYEGLRNMAFSTTPEQLGLQIPSDQTRVYGIVMDWDMGVAVATTVAYETGDASMYLSTGGGVIGGGQHDNVRTVVAPYVKKGQDYLDKATKTDLTLLPDKNCVRFYLLTNKGTYYEQETITNIENEKSAWFPLFEEANKVLTELRLTSEKKQKNGLQQKL